ncbi:MAG: hypothetical protein AAFU64_20755 [Bacteroidota bacterium]
MRILVYTLLFSFCILLTSCADQLDPILEPESFLIFGTYYGFCQGDCADIFKLTPDKLFEDQSDYLREMNDFEFTELSPEQFNQTKDILNNFPEEQLLREEASIIGCPDCADQGGIYIVYKMGGVEEKSTRVWYIDQSKSAVPNYLHPFIDAVKAKVQALQ